MRARSSGLGTLACNLLPCGPVDSPSTIGSGERAERLTAGAVMRRVEGIVSPADTLARAAERMAALGVRELPVVDGDRLVGIIVQTDLLPYQGHYEWTAVRAAMTRDVTTVSPEATVAAVAALLLERGVNSVPVVAGDRVVGMVGRTELLRPLAGANGGGPPRRFA